MGYSFTDTRYRIDGLIDTGQSVLDNLTILCNASGCWLTYDNHAGKWSVIINRAGTSQYSFDDSNIIGAISVSGTGLYNLYNGVKVSFPHEDLRSQKSYIQITIPDQDRFPNEPDNILQIDYQVVTNPVQSQLLGLIELKQSRVDKIITFTTDYSKIGVKAGDLIDVTNSIYGWTNKIFRVITVRENDGSDNTINIEITALEYDEDVYDITDLNRYTVSNENGIVAIGSIPAPDTPVVTALELVSNPRISASSEINGGIVEAVEFWITTDVPPGVNDETLRTYRLLGTVRPTNVPLFEPGDHAVLEVPSLDAGEFLIKARCINGTSSSAFSSPSGILTYNATQATDAIRDDTAVYDENGNLVNIAGLSALLAVANEFFGGNAAVGPGGGSGSGSTFLLLEIQNFNSNATTGGKYVGSGSKFVPIVRIIPPGVPGIVEGLDQRALSQCIIGDQNLQGGYLDLLANQPENLSYGPSNWPQYYPHKILQLCTASTTVNPATGPTYIYYGVDLNAYRYYYPTATKMDLEIRGYWQLEDQVVQYDVTNTSSTPITSVSDTVWETSTAGTQPIRANAWVWTGANISVLANSGNPPFLNSNIYFNTQGIGSSGNVVVTSSVYPAQLGNNVSLLSIGEQISTLTYDFTKPAYQAPKWNRYNFATAPTTTITVPKTWQINQSANVIANVIPTSNITVSVVPKNLGTTELYDAVTGPVGGNYLHAISKVARFQGNILPAFLNTALSPYPNMAWPKITLLPLTANVFQYDYVESQSQYYEGPPRALTGNEGIQEWWNLVGGRFGSYEGGGGDGQVYDETYSNVYSSVRRLYSNMAKINTTSFTYAAADWNQKYTGAADQHFIYGQWGQLKSTANVSSYNQNDYNFTGIMSSGQWWDRAGTDNFPFVEPTITQRNFDVGFFYNNANVTVNHLQITSNINANANADLGYGSFVTSV